jgi:myosin-5
MDEIAAGSGLLEATLLGQRALQPCASSTSLQTRAPWRAAARPRPAQLPPPSQAVEAASAASPLVLSTRTDDGALVRVPAAQCCLQNERDDTVDDLVRSDFLHEPGCDRPAAVPGRAARACVRGAACLVCSPTCFPPSCSILHTLRVRYALDAIYTFSGSILIAANPHKRLRHLYGPRM